MYGELINSLISFLLVAFAIYFFVVVPMNSLLARVSKKQETTPTTKKCKECLSEIPLQAKRCAFCSQKVK